MKLGASSYVKMLLSLLPNGLAWPKEPGTNIYGAVEALAEELARVDAAANRLIEEADPRTTLELLPDWERVVGLPDDCSDLAETYQQRREQVVSILTLLGATNKTFYINLAAALGFDISIHEYRPFLAGRGRAGDPVSNGDWIFAWRVDAPENTVREFRAGRSNAGEALAIWGNDGLECAISKRAPAGTIVLFAYGG